MTDQRMSVVAYETRLNEIGFGFYQISQLTLLSGVFFLHGAIFMLFFSSLYSLTSLPSRTRTLLVTCSLGSRSFGLFVGSFCKSRKLTVLVGLLFTATGLLGYSFSTGQVASFAWRATLHFGLGLAMPGAFCMTCEIVPRSFGAQLTWGLMGLVHLLGGTFSYYFLEFRDETRINHCDIGWKILNDSSGCPFKEVIEMIAVPSILFFFSCAVYLKESPIFFLLTGNHIEFNLALKHIAICNRKPQGPRFLNNYVQNVEIIGADSENTPASEIPTVKHPADQELVENVTLAAVRELMFKRGSFSLIAAFILNFLTYNFFIYIFKGDAGFNSLLAATTLVLAMVVGIRPVSIKFITVCLFFLGIALYWSHGAITAYLEVSVLLFVALLKIFTETELSGFFKEPNRMAGISSILGFACSVQSVFELAFLSNIALGVKQFALITAISSITILVSSELSKNSEPIYEKKSREKQLI